MAYHLLESNRMISAEGEIIFQLTFYDDSQGIIKITTVKAPSNPVEIEADKLGKLPELAEGSTEEPQNAIQSEQQEST